MRKKNGGGQRLEFVVDMENYPTLYKEDEAVDGITNQWEYYFKQPSGIKISEIGKYRHIIYGSNGFKAGNVPLYAGLQAPKVFPTREIVDEINSVYLPNIPFAESTLQYINHGREVFEDKIVLGMYFEQQKMCLREYINRKTVDIGINIKWA